MTIAFDQRTFVMTQPRALRHRALWFAVPAAASFLAHLPAVMLLGDGVAGRNTGLLAAATCLVLSAGLALLGTMAGKKARKNSELKDRIGAIGLMLNELILTLSLLAVVLLFIAPWR